MGNGKWEMAREGIDGRLGTLSFMYGLYEQPYSYKIND